MRKSALVINCIASAATVALAASFAMAAVSEGDYAGKSKAEITKSLEQLGYEVRKIETEDGYLEAYALLDGARFEIYVDSKTGKIVEIEKDD